MAWIKRNLFFLIGSIVALGLMIAGGFYLFTQVSEQSRVTEEINKQYGELQRLVTLNPHPGYGQIDNIKAAKEETAAIRAYIAKARPFFQRIAPIPDMGGAKIGSQDFASALRVTINEMHNSAQQQSVLLSTSNYYFSFEAQKNLIVFDPTSLEKLAVQLGEVKAICEVLFAAKINTLDYIRREAVSLDDKNQSDYISRKTIVTPLAELTPYEVKFRCFSGELAQVLSSFASSPDGFLVKAINVEPTSGGPEEAQPGMATPGAYPPTMATPQYPQPYRGYDGGRGARAMVPQQPIQPVAAPVASTKPQDFLNEKPFTVTLLIHVIKLKPETKPAK